MNLKILWDTLLIKVVVYLKFNFNWELYIFSGILGTEEIYAVFQWHGDRGVLRSENVDMSRVQQTNRMCLAELFSLT